VQNRLSRRLRALGLAEFSEYRRLVETDRSEGIEFQNALTTNVTSFFRETHHFDILREQVFSKAGLLKLWSCGCSTGEEAYSIAMTVLESGLQQRVQIQASDIDTRVLEHARAGVYRLEQLDAVPADIKQRYFLSGKGPHAGLAKVLPSVRALVRFRQLSIVDAWSIHGPLAAIFCRNVLIYFEPKEQARIVSRFVELLPKGGLLFLGHSESVAREEQRLRALGHTAYQRIG